MLTGSSLAGPETSGTERESTNPTATGRSGVRHSFDFIEAPQGARRAFDIVEVATEASVVAAFAKMLDTGVEVSLVCLTGRADGGARTLAAEYGIKIVEGDGVAGLSAALRKKVQERRAGTP